MGENTQICVQPEEIKTNTQDAVYPQGRWKINHDYKYFENNNGQYENSGKYISDLPDSLEKVGKYEILYEDVNIDPQYIYVHRRPEAIISVNRTGTNINLSAENSFDLDKKSVNNGISQEEWSYKKSDEIDWTEGKLQTIGEDDVYIVRLRVKDYQNTWSKYATKYVTMNATEPVAEFTPEKYTISKYENLTIIDNSYDPAGEEIIEETWTVSKDKTVVYTGETYLNNFLELGEGTYDISLKVKNESELESKVFTKTIVVTDDTIAPEVIAEPRTNKSINERQKINLEFTDEGGSGFKSYKYFISDRDDLSFDDIEWSSEITEDTGTIKITEYGDNYIYIKAKDNAENERNIILGNYYIDKKQIIVEVEKVDQENENIKLGNAKIVIQEEEQYEEDDRIDIGIINYDILTDENGYGDTTIDARQNKTKEYKIIEEIAPKGYNAITDSRLNITYDNNGNITNAQCNNSNVMTEVIDNETIKLTIKDEKQEEETFKLLLEAINKADENEKIKGIKYKVEYEAESGETLVLEELTNTNGQIEIPKLTGTGEIRIKITQTGRVPRYLFNDAPIYATINRDENGNIVCVPEKTSTTIEGEIQEKETVKIIIPNEKKAENNRIKLEVLEDEATSIEGLKFQLTDEYGINVQEGYLDEDGILNFDNITCLGKGDYIFTLIPEENNVYSIGTIRLKVTFTGTGIIEDIEEITSQTTETKKIVEEDEENIFNTGYIKIIVNKEENTSEQKIKIVKMDSLDNSKKLKDVLFKVKQSSRNCVKTAKRYTDASGEILVDLIDSDEIELKIKELQTIKGYIYNGEEATIRLVKNRDTGLMEVAENGNPQEVDITYDESNNIVIYQYNVRKIDDEGSKANISFFLTKIDENGNLLGNVKFLLSETKTGRVYNLLTDENGYVELPDFSVQEEGTYEFYVIEQSTVNGYELAIAPIKLIISYEEIDGEMKTSQIVVARGYKYIKYKRCDEYETNDTYQLDVRMTIINEKFSSGIIPTRQVIDVEKIDGEDGTQLPKAKYEIMIHYEDGTTIKQTDYVENFKTLLSTVSFPEGEEVTITLKEIEAPVGYQLDLQERTTTIKNTGGILSVKNSNAHSVELQENVLKITIADTKNTEMGYIPPRTPRDLTDAGYNIRIINNNIYNDRIRLEGSTFEAKVEKNGQIAYQAYRGLSVFSDIFNGVQGFYGIKVDGDQRIYLKQTRAPLHHIINDELYYLDILRDAQNNEIELVDKSHSDLDVTIDNEKRLITVVINNKPAELMVAINKVDAEDQSIGLANIGFMIRKHYDFSLSDLRSNGYLRTDIYGTGCATMSEYATSSTVLYEIIETNTPSGYYSNGAMGIYITTDRNGNITTATPSNDQTFFDIGKFTIDNYEDNYIELTVINNRKPEITYSVVIKDKNMYDTIEGVAGSKFNVQIDQQDGPSINSDVTTNGYGTATVGSLTGKGDLKIRVEQLQAGPGYKKNYDIINVEANRTLINTVSEQGNLYYKNIVLNSKNPTTTNVTIDNERQQIIIEVLNERVFGIEIKKFDYDDAEIFLPGAKFEVYSDNEKIGELTTNNNGIGYVGLGDAPSDTVKVYTIKEVEAPLGYEKVEDFTVTVTFDQSGRIRNISARGANVIVDNLSISCIRLKVMEPKEGGNPGPGEESETYTSLQIIKQNYNNPKLNIEKVVFRIETEAEDGRGITAIKSTNENGEINLSKIPGDRITIKLKEIETDAGYYLDDEERVIVVEKIEDKIKLVEEETSDDLIVAIDENSRIIKVTIKNKIKSEDVIGLALVKEDSEDELLTLAKAEFEIEDVETGDIYTLKTGKKGAGIVFLEPKKVEGTYIYNIKETKAPSGYFLNDSITELEVEFKLDPAGKSYINSVRLNNNEDIIEIQNMNQNYIELHMKDEPDESISAYDIKVVKVDRDDIDIKLPGAMLEINVQNSIGQTGLSKIDTTDAEGKIMIRNVRGAGNVEIDITELLPPELRKFDLKQKKAILTKDPITGRLKLVDSLNVDTIISNKEKLITILVRNEQIDGYYTLVLDKKDKDDKEISLSNVKMKIEIQGERDPIEAYTDKDGKIIIPDLKVPTKGKLKFKVTELETIEGYQKLDKPIEFEIEFIETLLRAEITRAKITKGSDDARVLEVLPKYVRVGIYNEKEKEQEDEPYKITVIKKDTEKGKVLEGAKIKLHVMYEDGEGITVEKYTDEEGKICLEDLTKTGITSITVQEIEAPYGYELDPKEREVKCEIEDSKNMEITEKDEELEVSLKDKEIEIILPNQKADEYAELHVEKFINKVNDRIIEDREPVVTIEDDTITYTKPGERKVVELGDILEFTIRVYNEGNLAGYANEIKDYIPDGLEYVENNEVNQVYGWEKSEENVYVTRILSKDNGEDNIIEAYDEENGLKYKDVKIVLKVVEKADNNPITINIAEVDKIGPEDGPEKPIDPPPGEEEVEIKYVKFVIDKIVSKITLIENGEETEKEVNEHGVSKVEVDKKNINSSMVEVEYEITVTNIGTKRGKPAEVIDYLPEGMSVVEEKSPGWSKEGKYIEELYLEPGESKTLVITLICSASDTGKKINKASVVEITEVDPPEEPTKEDPIQKEEISPEATVIITPKTGETPLYIGLAIVMASMLGIGVFIIRKKILV